MNILYLFLLLFVSPVVENVDTVLLQGVDIVSSMKIGDDETANPYSHTTVRRVQIENRHINSLKELSSLAPNFYQPDYGSRMTSSLYVRGYGSRIDQPVVGLNIDEMPVLNKNNYDFDFFDIDKVQIIRGAQSTLYGRNTAGGTINVYTLSPLVFQGKRLMLEYGNENSFRLKASHYAAPARNFGWSSSVYYAHTDGFFHNEERGEKCDEGDNISLRLRLQYLPAEQWSIDNSFSLSYLDEGGYAYRAYNRETGALAPVAYNDYSGYRRFNLSNGMAVKYFCDNFTMSSVTSLQYTNDCMRMDNDFLPLDYFALRQEQREYAFTQEFVIKSDKENNFQWLAGVFAMYKNLKMSAPVHFKQYGIDNLILKNANDYYYSAFGPNRRLEFKEDNFAINSDFDIPVYSLATFFQLSYKWHNWELSAGLRLDYEYSAMDYASNSLVHYKTYIDSNVYTPLHTNFVGDRSLNALELLPHLSLSYNSEWGDVYVSARRGFKSGGFNTQLFSDILQKKMGGMLIGNEIEDDASSTVYSPETNWSYEAGVHLSPLADGNLDISASVFYIDCRDQQLTVFPKGLSTGRMMSNAGKSHSYGYELSAAYTIGRFTIDTSFGYTLAVFDRYLSGDNDYSGKYMPYAPRETYSANISYNIPVPRSFANFLVLDVGWNGTGKICWNEDNSLSQSGYGVLSASLSWEKGHFGASVWGKNLLDEEYDVFYFHSIGNDFFAQGKPLQLGVSIYLNL